MDPDRLNSARIRLSRLGHLNSGDEEVSFDRVEFAISLTQAEHSASKWRIQTLTTLMTQKTQGKTFISVRLASVDVPSN